MHKNKRLFLAVLAVILVLANMYRWFGGGAEPAGVETIESSRSFEYDVKVDESVLEKYRWRGREATLSNIRDIFDKVGRVKIVSDSKPILEKRVVDEKPVSQALEVSGLNIKMLAILSQSNRAKALIELDGETQMVQAGSILKKKYEITKIDAGKIYIRDL